MNKNLFFINPQLNSMWITPQGNYGNSFIESRFFTLLKGSLGIKASGLIGADYLGIVAKQEFCGTKTPVFPNFTDNNEIKIVTNCQAKNNCNTLSFLTEIEYNGSILSEGEIRTAEYFYGQRLFNDNLPDINNSQLNIPEFPSFCIDV